MKLSKTGLIVGCLLSVTLLAYAAQPTFNLYSPATGIQKNTGATYVNTAAASTDVRALWSGTCDSTTYLRGDGSCQTPPGTGGGTVNSVALTAPSIFSVTGSPVTTSGTLAFDFATGQTQNRVLASPNGSSGAISLRALVAADLPAVPLATGVSGTLPVANGGTGVTSLGALTRTNDTNVTLTLGGSPTTALVNAASMTLGWSGQLAVARGGTGAATLSGLLKGNGTSAIGAAANTDVISLWTGTCNSSTFLRADGSCNSVTATPAGSSGQVQFNSTGVFGGDAAFTWNPGTGVLAATNFFGNGSSITALNATQLTSGTVPDARFPSTLPALDGSALTALNASQLTTGTLPDGRFPGTLPAMNGSALFSLNASNLGSGTVPDARFPATLPALNGSALTALNATNLASGTVADARLSSNIPLKNAANTFTNNLSVFKSSSALVSVTESVTGYTSTFGNNGAAFYLYSFYPIPFQISTNGAIRAEIGSGGGATITSGGSAPTGGNKGDGTLNTAGTIYQNNVAVALSSDLSALNATNLTSGTVNNARLPSTINVSNDVQIGGVGVCRNDGTNCDDTPSVTSMTAGSGTFTTSATVAGSNVCRADGVNCPAGANPAYGRFTGSAGGCTIVTSNDITSCSRTGTGSYTVTLTTNRGHTPICLVTPIVGTAGVFGRVGSTSGNTTVGVNIGDSISAVDANFSLACY
jgi:hypothetical protein